jgi:hypothetical protein
MNGPDLLVELASLASRPLPDLVSATIPHISGANRRVQDLVRLLPYLSAERASSLAVEAYNYILTMPDDVRQFAGRAIFGDKYLLRAVEKGTPQDAYLGFEIRILSGVAPYLSAERSKEALDRVRRAIRFHFSSGSSDRGAGTFHSRAP